MQGTSTDLYTLNIHPLISPLYLSDLWKGSTKIDKAHGPIFDSIQFQSWTKNYKV